jgi:hypothetical protein
LATSCRRNELLGGFELGDYNARDGEAPRYFSPELHVMFALLVPFVVGSARQRLLNIGGKLIGNKMFGGRGPVVSPDDGSRSPDKAD